MKYVLRYRPDHVTDFFDLTNNPREMELQGFKERFHGNLAKNKTEVRRRQISKRGIE